MGGLTFEGALKNISHIQLEFIKEVLEKRGYNDRVVHIEAVGAAGDNFIANVKRITVDGENGPFKMIAKIAPQNENVRMATQTQVLFGNEHHMYTVVLPKYQQLEEEAEIPNDDRFRFAECYGSSTQVPHEVILLEDLLVPGFKMLDRFTSLSDECIRSTLKNFAKFHALSFALKNKQPETFNSLKSKLFDMWSHMDSSADIYFGKLEAGAEQLVEGEERKNIIRGAIGKALSMARKIAQVESGSKYFVIQQGDSWTNNIMFRYDGENLVESVLIDYQISKETSPVCDIQYMIFNCTDHKTRLKYFNEWLDYYHAELEKRLTNFGLKIENVYPREQFDADMKKYSGMMLGLSTILASVLTMNSEDAGKMKETMESTSPDELPANNEVEDYNVEHTIKFKTRLEGLIDSYLEFNLI